MISNPLKTLGAKTLLSLVLLLILALPAHAGDLQEFENDLGRTADQDAAPGQSDAQSLQAQVKNPAAPAQMTSEFDVSEIFFLPLRAFTGQRDRNVTYAYSPHPYAGGHGPMILPSLSSQSYFERETGAQTRPFMVETSTQYQHVSDNLQGYDFSAMLRRNSPSGFRIDYVQFTESSGGVHDKLELFSGHLTYSALQSSSMMVDLMLGIRTVSREEKRTGVEFGMGLDWFPLKPFVLDTELRFAVVDGNNLTDIRGGLGVVWKAYQLRAGYRTIRTTNTDLSGPEAGLVMRF